MQSHWLTALLVVAPATAAFAQTSTAPLSRPAQRIPAPKRFGGTYHVASSTFTRGHAGVRSRGAADAIYAANADVPYFAAIEPGEQFQDTGIVPGSTNTLVAGGRDDNLVTGFDFAYCDLDPTLATTSFEIDFYESAVPCAAFVGPGPTASFVLSQLPAVGQCWVVNVDVTGGSEFCIRGDGGDSVFQDSDDLDSFGWAIRYTGGGTNPATGTSSAGPLVGADPQATDTAYLNLNGPPWAGVPVDPPAPPSVEGTGTYYNPLSNCTTAFVPGGVPRPAGSGLRNPDFYYIDASAAGGATTGCYYFLGYFNLSAACGGGGPVGSASRPFAAFYMELSGTDSCDGFRIISTPTSCPATPNTSGVPGACEVEGSAFVLNNDVLLRARQLPTTPAGVFGIFVHGLADLSSTPIQTGQGVLCVGGAGRLQALNQIQQANALGVAEVSVAAGNLNIGALPLSVPPFAIAASSGVTSYFAFWHRDFGSPSASAFNFTASCSVVWQ